jgi:multidrug efflux pump subunit AcrA (membrane-fusion protein)
MAFLPAIVPILGTVLSAGGAVLSGINSIQQGNYQNAVAQQNARAADSYAAAEAEAAQREAMRSDREYAILRGEQLAAQGASGLDLLGRTQLQTRKTTDATARDARTDIRQRGTYESRKLQQEASNFRAEGSAAKRQGLVSGIGSFLRAGSEVADHFSIPRSLASSRSRRRSSYRG